MPDLPSFHQPLKKPLRFSDPQELSDEEAHGYPLKANSSTEINNGV
jgi:hypothetical protein